MNLCCKEKDNLEVITITPDKMTQQCKVCSCKHYRMKADPGVIGVVGKDLGKSKEEALLEQILAWIKKNSGDKA